MKNKLSDLNNHLFAQLEKLGEEDLKGDKLDAEIERAKAISSISKQIVESSKLTLEAAKFVNGEGLGNRLPESFGIEPKKLGSSS